MRSIAVIRWSFPRDAIAGTPSEYTEQVLQHTLGYIATITSTADLVTAWKGD